MPKGQREHLLRVGFNTRFKPHKIKRNCDLCGKEYERIPSDIGKYCSYKCSNNAPERVEIRKMAALNTKNGKELKCLQCGTIFYVPKCRQLQKYCSDECRTLASRKPEELKTNKVRLKEWRLNILKRDNYQCVECRCNRKRLLEVHHIKSQKEYPRLIYDLENGQTLCVYCHIKKHKNLSIKFMLSSLHLNGLRKPYLKLIKEGD